MTIVKTSRFAPPLILTLLAGCSGGTGVISGQLVAVGGPANMRQPLPGMVQISGEGHEFMHRVPPSADGSFSVEVPAGTYVVSGRSPLYQGGRLDYRYRPALADRPRARNDHCRCVVRHEVEGLHSVHQRDLETSKRRRCTRQSVAAYRTMILRIYPNAQGRGLYRIMLRPATAARARPRGRGRPASVHTG